ncbi:MAG: glycosyltransferase [Nanoarchaeota archaeon]|nr:glycosyltransferase [Nanoarchaeota archaeon]
MAKKLNYLNSKPERNLNNKKIVVAMWGCEDSEFWPYQWCTILKGFMGEVISFDPRKRKLEYGSKRMQEELYKIIEEKKPDFFIFLIESNEVNIDTIKKINELSPNTKTIVHFGDDDLRFENRSRYYSLFVDYSLIPQIDKIDYYKKEGIKNAYPVIGANTENFKPLKVKKKYGVSFVGHPLPSRVEYLEFLLKNGINVELFGHGWDNYPQFKEIYKGALPTEDFIKVVNETKINLGFSRNHIGVPHFKGRVFDIAACNSFQLVDYFPEYKKYYKENKELVMFHSKEELLKKIKYYLKNEKQRENIAINAYKRTLKDNDFVKLFKKFFGNIVEEEKIFKRAPLPNINKKYITLKKEFFEEEKGDDFFKDYNYISFSTDSVSFSEYKNYLQAYSLEKSKKEISCCGYYVYSKKLGNYMTFNNLKSMKNLKKEEFEGLFNINQLMVRKDFFLKNKSIFKDIFLNEGKIDFITEDNTAFITIPLLHIERLSKLNYITLNKMNGETLDKALQLNFIFEIYTKVYQKKLIFDSYIYKIMLHAIPMRNHFILKSLVNYMFKEEIRNKLKSLLKKT